MQELLRQGIREIGLNQLGKKEEALFYLYLKELQKWNRKFNLTAYEEERDIVIYHFLDSLLPLPFFPRREGKLLDIGTGAGFPGIPLKILEPRFSLYLLEVNRKKLFFLHQLRERLGLEFEILEGRAEDIAKLPNYRETFDLVVARAIASLPVLLEYGLPFLKLSGYLIAYKGPKLLEELEQAGKALTILGGRLESAVETTLPITGEKRMFAIFLKERETPSNYPRRAGIPAKRPLK